MHNFTCEKLTFEMTVLLWYLTFWQSKQVRTLTYNKYLLEHELVNTVYKKGVTFIIIATWCLIKHHTNQCTTQYIFNITCFWIHHYVWKRPQCQFHENNRLMSFSPVHGRWGWKIVQCQRHEAMLMKEMHCLKSPFRVKLLEAFWQW